MFPPKEKPDWKRIIDEKEKRERDELEARFRDQVWREVDKNLGSNYYKENQ